MDQLIPLEAVQEAEANDIFEVWPEHWDAVHLFEACDSQWTVLLGMGGLVYQGLDMGKVTTIARDWLRIELKEQLFWQLRVLESEGRQIRNAAKP